ncbi:MAG: hypothetical protein QOG54_2514 [Actinomycetota bacterium]|nr:hypothetical protein [Actinomycetota bacterium]
MIESEAPLAERVDVDRDREVAALFNKHYTPMCRLAFVILGDSALAEEIVMEALLKTFSGWRRIRDHERAEFYLKRAVVNLCRSRIRRKMVEQRASALMDRSAAISTWDPSQSDTRRAVWDAVRKLPERQRASVVLRYFEDLPEAEIAEVLDCSVGTVKSQLFKARQKLGSVLGAEAPGGDR